MVLLYGCVQVSLGLSVVRLVVVVNSVQIMRERQPRSDVPVFRVQFQCLFVVENGITHLIEGAVAVSSIQEVLKVHRKQAPLRNISLHIHTEREESTDNE